jgi:hypothetical protein
MDLVKGDWNNLEGRVIVYSKFKNKNTELSILPNDELIAKHFLIGFNKKNRPSEEHLNKLLNEYKQKYKLPKNILGMLIPMEIRNIDLYSEDTLKERTEDVLYTGEFSDIYDCNHANILGMYVYQFRIMKQREDLGIEVNNNYSELKRYKNVNSIQLLEHITKEYIVRLIDYTRFSDKKEYQGVKKEFMNFSKNSPFEKEAIELTKIIEQNPINPDVELIGKYLHRIVNKKMLEEMNIELDKAIKVEKYEEAVIYRDKIKDLTQSLKQN